jgi:GNAT superfamily N-acetyltransferase
MMTRRLEPADTQAASELVRRGFETYVAPEWEPEAAREFVEIDIGSERMGRLIAESAFTAGTFGDGGELLGLLIMPQPTWLALLFVDPDLFRRGIARELWERARRFILTVTPPVEAVDLNASTFAIGFYLKVGFVTGERVELKGRRGTRMVWKVKA